MQAFKSSIIELGRAYGFSVHSIYCSPFVKFSYEENTDLRLCVRVIFRGPIVEYELTLFYNSELYRNWGIFRNEHEVSYAMQNFKTLATIKKEIHIDEDDKYEDMVYNCELGI